VLSEMFASAALNLSGSVFVPQSHFEHLKNLCLGMGILFSNQFIILCCSNKRAMIKGSDGNGFPLAFIATEYF
jgi:hypothetical protein